MSDSSDAAALLGQELTSSEARGIADRLEAGQTLSQALVCVRDGCAPKVRSSLTLLAECESVGWAPVVALLRAIEHAKSEPSRVVPVWTAPASPSLEGGITSSRDKLVSSARKSVVCSTFNVQRSTPLWNALEEVSVRPGVSVRLYLDTEVCDGRPAPWRPTTEQVARELPNVEVFRTRELASGDVVCNHAKFIAVDHRTILVTSANFSNRAESDNVELGLRVDDPSLVRKIERQMMAFEETVYERVR